MKSALTICVLLFILFGGDVVRADAYRIAVIVGNNRAATADLDDLQFADDDAFKYHHFLMYLTNESVLLARPDAESSPLYKGEQSVPPTRDNVLAALDETVSTALARANNGDEVTVYFIFSGHGTYDAEGRGYLHLEDGKLTTRDLFYRLIGPSRDFNLILLIDACNASFLVQSRGQPATDRRPVGKSTLNLEDYPNVGLILSASAIGEVKEWGRYLSGIFSHQVRSALSGVADLDGDQQITYQELASFIAAANQDVDNPALRLKPYIRPPLGTPEQPVVDLTRSTFPRELEVTFKSSSRITIFNSNLVRFADFHVASGYPLSIFLPSGTMFLQVGKHTEYVIPEALTGKFDLSALETRDSEVLSARGIDAYFVERLYAQPYSAAFANDYLSGTYQQELVFERTVQQPWYENGLAWSLVGPGLALLTSTGALQLAAASERAAALTTQFADERNQYNRHIDSLNTWSIATAIVGAAALAAGTTLFFVHTPVEKIAVIPEVGPGIRLAPSIGGLTLDKRF